MLWLALALSTEAYNPDKKPLYYNELIGYTHPVYSFNIRQLAFAYLRDLNAFNAKAIKNLEQASQHHNWQFRSFSSKLLKQLEKVD